MLAEGQQTSAQGYSQYPPATVQNPEKRDGETAALLMGAESDPLTPSVAPPLPGHFVSTRYESDCARFVSDAKRLAHLRAEALARPSAAF